MSDDKAIWGNCTFIETPGWDTETGMPLEPMVGFTVLPTEKYQTVLAEVSAYKPVYEAALEVSRRNSTKRCLGLTKLRDALTEHQKIAHTIKGAVSGRENQK